MSKGCLPEAFFGGREVRGKNTRDMTLKYLCELASEGHCSIAAAWALVVLE